MNTPARTGSGNLFARRSRRTLICMLLIGVLLPAARLPASEQVPDPMFEHHEIVIGSRGDHTVLAAFLLDGATAELAVVNVDDEDRRRLRLYAFDRGTWTEVLAARLGEGVEFVDVARIGGRDRLLTYESGRLNWFDPVAATERSLVEISTDYRSTERGLVPHVDITRDLNRDGRDDLVVPAVDGFWISTQAEDGSFAAFTKLGPPEPMAHRSIGHLDVQEPPTEKPRTYAEVGITAHTIPVYLSRVHRTDWDQDGRSDLVFWNEDHFEVYFQDGLGLFDPVAEVFTTDVPIESEGAYSRAFEYSDQGMASLLFGIGKSTEQTVLHSIRDLNGDDTADLVTLTLTGPSLTKQRSVYGIHFGRPRTDGTDFPQQADLLIRPRGKAGGLAPWGYAAQRYEDYDGDGRTDLMFMGVRVGMGGMVRALVGNSVPIDLEFYRNQDGVYADRPTATRRIRRFAPFAGPGNVFFPTVLMGDVNGDGRSDLLVGHSPEELRVFLGKPGPDLLARQPTKIDAALPYNERNSWLIDLNGDGKQDVLMLHTPTDGEPTRPSRLATLIAR